jgi:protein-S-isoprenylcysteine O-methyltransferase Ste14
VSGARVAVAFVAALAFFAALLFWPAGRLDWWAGWLYFGLLLVWVATNYVLLRRFNPELIEHRVRLGPGTKTWDKLWSALFAPVFYGVYVVAGLDAVRFESSEMSLWWWPLGLAAFLPGAALLTWSMVVNPFFERTVRIQLERGHRVVDTGPYAVVRHPGYAGFLSWIASAPLLLGSWWACLPAAICVVGLVIRTALEDRTLQRELTGYEEYTQRVRFRLIPGVW